MANAGQVVLYLGGLVALAGIGYYLHTTGAFTAGFKAVNELIDKLKTGTGTSSDDKDKDEDKDEEDKDDKDDKDKEEDEDKESNLALAYVGSTPFLGMSRHRAYKVYRR